MNETQNDELEKTADGEPLTDRGIADSANDPATDAPEGGDDDEQEDDGEDEEDEEDLGL